MNPILKSGLRTIYRALVRNPIMKAVIDREVRGEIRRITPSWETCSLQDFVEADHGRDYGVTRRDRARLIQQFTTNNREIRSGTSLHIHTILAREILQIPPQVAGDVIECGVWKGASTASLSLVCKMVGRRLVACDSFEGLPDDGLKPHVVPHAGHYGYYKKGMFCGRFDEVRNNIEKFGALEVCDFVTGFFSESLEALSSPIAFAFLDVDLVSSTEDCLRHIWPLLVEGGKLYTDDAGDLDVVRRFFDEAWWQENLQSPSPGYIGSGCGLPLNPQQSSLGYARKLSTFEPGQWRTVSWLHYPDQADPLEPVPGTKN